MKLPKFNMFQNMPEFLDIVSSSEFRARKFPCDTHNKAEPKPIMTEAPYSKRSLG